MSKWETVIGLEIHAELMTESKLFCACSSRFGADPNRSVCPVCMGHPGTMPTLNRRAVELAVRAGKMLGCTISPFSMFDRKHYAYPDLPKGYQITQFFFPICIGGALTAEEREFRLTRIHLEEDAGKLFHAGGQVLADYNRCGVPLIEIVTEPDFRSAEEASAFFRKLREVLLFAGICDGKMNEGSLRCDVNLSLHRPGEPLGERTEIKNLNSFRFLERAIHAEEARQCAILDRGERVGRQTLRFDEASGETVPMREKEEAADYRFFPEPDLPPLELSWDQIETMCRDLPEHPDHIRARLATQNGLPKDVIESLMISPSVVKRYEATAALTEFPLLCGRLYAECVRDKTVDAAHFAELCDLAGREEIARSDAKRLASRLTEEDFSPNEEAERCGMRLICDETLLAPVIAQVLAENPERVRAYREGKTELLGFFVGAVKRALPFRTSAKILSEQIERKLAADRESDGACNRFSCS